MKKTASFTIIFLILILSSCSLFRVHKLDVEQGNIITQENINQLQRGMTESQVKTIMGDPILINVFTPKRLNYIYTYQKGYEKMMIKRVVLIFDDGRLQEVIQPSSAAIL
ncbi:MAG: hypothetical protein A3F42_02685 [Gammaproteobacteria bacterium RIFCSPHIGHO2_12_FULL_37_34]|nr:MAG: hypothetical protein A3F42_02685 [Gammaproteobacteria bacterium RIFCSPHIGHO2_12_FULL_37_34]